MDPETKAIIDIIEILSPLEPSAIERILGYLTNRYSSKTQVTSASSVTNIQPPTKGFAGVYELFDLANPNTTIEKVLVTAYWFQNILGHDELDSSLINQELHNMGHPSSNVSRDLDALINRRFVRQIRKEGGRRKYRLTHEGIRAVEKMLGSSPSSSKEESPTE